MFCQVRGIVDLATTSCWEMSLYARDLQPEKLRCPTLYSSFDSDPEQDSEDAEELTQETEEADLSE